MKKQSGTSRRAFVACCVCAGCAGLVGAADEAPKRTLSTLSGSTPKKTYDFAFCGIYCSACKLHLKGGDDGRKCVGCTHPKMESGCGIFKCAKEKKVANCGLCETFESCEKLKQYHDGAEKYKKAARKNCARIKADGGSAKFAAEQKARWTCKACKKLFYSNPGTDTACPWCKKPVDPLTDAEA